MKMQFGAARKTQLPTTFYAMSALKARDFKQLSDKQEKFDVSRFYRMESINHTL